jgi:hypothetical protein
MEVPSTDRLKRKQEVKDERPFWKAVVQGMVSGLVRFACSQLCNQRTWHYMAVKIPEWIQLVFDVLKL